MNINKFKKGDIITRIESTEKGDRSFMGDKMELVGVEKGMIVAIDYDFILDNKIMKLRTDWWSDGWDYYPQSLIDKAKKRQEELKKLNNKQ